MKIKVKNSNGEFQEVTIRGIQGEKGEKGEKGETGGFVSHTHIKSEITDFAHTHTSTDLPSTLAYKDGTLQTGLNAEKLNGKSINQLRGHDTNFEFMGINGGDANNITFEYNRFVFNMANVPNNDYGFLEVCYYTGNGFSPSSAKPVILQKFYSYNTKLQYTRIKNGNEAWTSWKKQLNQDDYDTLFQYANNGKTSIANAIGDVTSASTHQQIADHVTNLKNQISTDLASKGVSIPSSNTLWSLANGIKSISTGKRFASGVLYNHDYPNTGGSIQISVVINNIGFKPRLLDVCYVGAINGKINSITSYNEDIANLYNYYYSFSYGTSVAQTIASSGFSYSGTNGGTVTIICKLQVDSPSPKELRWYAYE